MGWFSDLFQKKSPKDNLPPVRSPIAPMPKVKPCKPEKTISEPVYAIVKAMQERPSNFKVRHNSDIMKNIMYPIFVYRCKDVKTNQEISVTSSLGYNSYLYSSTWKWLTSDEISFLVEAYTEIYKNKLKRSNGIQRAAMKAIYK